MKRFEYEITMHGADSFREIVYFCSEDGQCNLERIPSDQIVRFQDILNDHGSQGWELVQVSFGKDGVLAFWKRMIKDRVAPKEESISV